MLACTSVMSSSHHRKHVDHCLNCGAPTPDAFCAACGQEAVDAAVTFRDQMAHFFEEVIGVESRLPRTVKLLLTRPGALTRAYNGGQRVRYVTPLKLYLFASVAFFLVLSLSAARGKTHLVDAHDDHHAQITIGASPSAAGSEHFASVDAYDAWLKEPGNAEKVPAFLEPHLRSFIKSPEGFLSTLLDTMSKASMALVPIHALLLKLLYWRPRRLYGEHIVFSLHLHAFAYVAYGLSTLIGLVASAGVGGAADSIAFLGGAVYSVAAARTAYAEGVVRSAIKMAIVAVGYGMALAGVVGLAAAAAFFQG